MDGDSDGRFFDECAQLLHIHRVGFCGGAEPGFAVEHSAAEEEKFIDFVAECVEECVEIRCAVAVGGIRGVVAPELEPFELCCAGLDEIVENLSVDSGKSAEVLFGAAAGDDVVDAGPDERIGGVAWGDDAVPVAVAGGNDAFFVADLGEREVCLVVGGEIVEHEFGGGVKGFSLGKLRV